METTQKKPHALGRQTFEREVCDKKNRIRNNR